MAAYQTGETIRLKAAITDVNDVVASPTTVKISINKPNGVAAVESADMINPSAGSYYYDYLIPSDEGTYSWKTVATGASSRVTIVKSLFSGEESI